MKSRRSDHRPSSTTKTVDLDARRAARLEEDLAAAGVKRPLSPDFAAEVLYALFPPVHERLTPNFGALTYTPYAFRSEGVTWVQMRLPLESTIGGFDRLGNVTERQAARQLCDGYSTFLLADVAEPDNLLAATHPVTELDLVNLGREGIYAVQRTGDGKVKLFLPEFLAVHDKNAWAVRPYSREMADPIRSAAAVFSDVGERLLDLAVHVLSPANVGATMVWLLDDQAVDSPCLNKSHATPVEPLDVSTTVAYPALRSLCSQNDRAVVVSTDGRLLSFGVELVAAPGTPALVTDGGTRHNSAANASNAEDRAVFYVVSSDGPVSVFYAGVKIATFVYGQWARECPTCEGSGRVVIKQEVDSSRTDSSTRGDAASIECPNCDATGRRWFQGPIVPDRASPPRRRQVVHKASDRSPQGPSPVPDDLFGHEPRRD